MPKTKKEEAPVKKEEPFVERCFVCKYWNDIAEVSPCRTCFGVTGSGEKYSYKHFVLSPETKKRRKKK